MFITKCLPSQGERVEGRGRVAERLSWLGNNLFWVSALPTNFWHFISKFIFCTANMATLGLQAYTSPPSPPPLPSCIPEPSSVQTLLGKTISGIKLSPYTEACSLSLYSFPFAPFPAFPCLFLFPLFFPLPFLLPLAPFSLSEYALICRH